ncbi:hypothetical protein TNCV_4591401 [Trichonephila clavipes]|nr:hypothetical protein TNCV_4591401 [Trichonephila clavipes]
MHAQYGGSFLIRMKRTPVTEKNFFLTIKDRAVHLRQKLRTIYMPLMKLMGKIQRRHQTFHKQNVNHIPLFLLGADRQRSCHNERYATLQRLQRKTSDTLYISDAVYPSFSVGYQNSCQTFERNIAKSPFTF